MIHYHGLPLTPAASCAKAISGAHAFVSFAHADQLGIAIEVAQSFALDNGAFSAWKAGRPIQDWSEYHEMVAYCSRIPSFDFAVIPDVISGASEKDQDDLLNSWPWRDKPWIGAPVWHMHESFERLKRLAIAYPRVCIGSSGEYSEVGSRRWWMRMGGAMSTVCDCDGRPITKIHGLRMLDPNIFSRLPFASADSTNMARNVGLDSRWTGAYAPASKDVRALVLRNRIEAFNGAVTWDKNHMHEQYTLPILSVASA